MRITYFVRDDRKAGGKVVEEDVTIHQIDFANRVVISNDRKEYDMGSILQINGDVIRRYKRSAQ